MSTERQIRRRPGVLICAVISVLALVTAACSSDGTSDTSTDTTAAAPADTQAPDDGGDTEAPDDTEAPPETEAPAADLFTGEDPDTFTLLTNVENQQTVPILEILAEGACSAQNDALPLDGSSMPQADLDAQVQLLASQDALPAMFSGGGNPSEGEKLWKAGKLVDFNDAMTKLGVLDNVEPAAISTIERIYGGAFNFLPYQFNIEGIFYNKALFEEHGVSEPQTWDELLAAAQTFQDAGLTPLAASGEQGWPITRLISGHIFRSLGPDALEAVRDGSAKLTDPEYVASAQAIADLGAAGYFGDNVTSLDYDGATNEFLTGNAAMIYMGTWLLGNINDPEQNQLEGGADQVGFMPFPGVEGGAGSIDQYPANVGTPATFGADTLGPKVASWLGCITENFGSTALSEFGTITGFKVNTPVDGVPAITQEVQERIASGGQSVLWFETLFTPKANNNATGNVPLLVTGDMSADEYMSIIQADLDAGG